MRTATHSALCARRSTLLSIIGALLLVAAPDRAGAQAGPLGRLISGLGVTARVLVIGAHPDDEDTPLIAYLSRSGRARVAYLSLTRGESGQNLIGGETGLALGVLRTQEVLAARRVDGAEQYFTSAIDFGATKTADETLARWGDRDGTGPVLGDVVTIVRAFRPHVVISVFDSLPNDGNGQHAVAGRIARALFAAAADTTRFPADAHYGRPWAPLKLYRLARADEPARADDGMLRVDVGEYDALSGRSYAEVAAESRSRQRSQGVVLPTLGARWDRLRLLASRVGAVDGHAERSMFDGIDTTLARLPRTGMSAALVATMDSLPAAIARTHAAYRADDPSDAVAPLGAVTMLAARAAALAGETMRGATYDADAARSLEDLWRRARAALVLAAGVAIEATADREIVAKATAADSSDTLRVAIDVYARGRVSVRVDGATMTGAARWPITTRTDVAPDSAWHGTVAGTPRVSTGPWWLVEPPLGTLYAPDVDGRSEREWDDATEVGAMRAYVRLHLGGADALVTVPIVARRFDPARGDVQRPVAAVPGITVRFNLSTQYARAGVPLRRPIRVAVQSAYSTDRDVEVTLELPRGLTADSAVRRIRVPAGAARDLWFVVRGTPTADKYELHAIARTPGWKYGVGAATIAYDHIDPQRIFYDATSVIQGVDVTFAPGIRVAYVSGVGDAVVPKLQQLGLLVTTLDPGSLALPNQDFSRFDVVVLGPRAYEAHPELVATNALLLAYVRAGGRLVVQHGQQETIQAAVLPYPITLADPPQRVTYEDAPVRIVDPASRVLAVPNHIVPADFDFWSIDRAAFMPTTFDRHYKSVLEMHDPDEPPNRGAILVAPYGQGTYVYTTLSFFRQLGAANPGAARLFVNLLSKR